MTFRKLSKALNEPTLDEVYASLRELEDEEIVGEIQRDVSKRMICKTKGKRKRTITLNRTSSQQIESYSDPYSLHMFMVESESNFFTIHGSVFFLTGIYYLAIASILDLRFASVSVLNPKHILTSKSETHTYHRILRLIS